MSGDSLSERDELLGGDLLRPVADMQPGMANEREARMQQVETRREAMDPLPGVSTETAADWRPVTEPLSPLDEPAKPNQGASGMQSQTPGMQTQSMTSTGPQTILNEYMEYEDDFRANYDAKYAATGEPYEDYQGARIASATLGNDDRFRSRAWDEQMEYETRRDWENRHPEGDTWDRFKAASRHSWDRVTGHHHV